LATLALCHNKEVVYLIKSYASEIPDNDLKKDTQRRDHADIITKHC